MTTKELFDFITDLTITEENIDLYLEKIQEKILERDEIGISNIEKVNEEVFKNAFIPRTLNEVIDVEKDIQKISVGITTDVYYNYLKNFNFYLDTLSNCFRIKTRFDWSSKSTNNT